MGPVNDLDNMYYLSPGGSIVAVRLSDGKVMWAYRKDHTLEKVSGTKPHYYGLVKINCTL